MIAIPYSLLNHTISRRLSQHLLEIWVHGHSVKQFLQHAIGSLEFFMGPEFIDVVLDILLALQWPPSRETFDGGRISHATPIHGFVEPIGSMDPGTRVGINTTISTRFFRQGDLASTLAFSFHWLPHVSTQRSACTSQRSSWDSMIADSDRGSLCRRPSERHSWNFHRIQQQVLAHHSPPILGTPRRPHAADSNLERPVTKISKSA